MSACVRSTGRGSCMRNTICGVRGSRSGSPSASCMTGTVTENGRVSGPTISTSSPAANLLRSESVASPSGVQSVTMAQTCQSRI